MLPVLAIFYLWQLSTEVAAQTSPQVEVAFPEAWNGDRFRNVVCRASSVPEWLDGFYISLVGAAYGRRRDPAGSKLTHMYDGLAGLASLQFKEGMVRFSGRYVPTKAFKIWDFYGRDMRESQVAWSTLRSVYNSSARDRWELIEGDQVAYNPNVDLWKIGRRVVAVAETPDVGLQFDVQSLDNFQQVRLKETNDLFSGRGSIKPLASTVHSRQEPDGSLYGSMSGIDPSTNRMYQFVYKINVDGVRTVEGAFEYGRYESFKCGSDQRYMADKRVLAGVINSITTTKQYVILPISSAVINPCKYPFNRRRHLRRFGDDRASNGNRSAVNDLQLPIMAAEFATDVPVRFLVFHKQRRQFVTGRPLDSFPPRFVSHQLNAYELSDRRLVADMITYDNMDGYDKHFDVNHLLNDGYRSTKTRLVRFTLDLESGQVERSYLLPEGQPSAEFPTINPLHVGRSYRYGYLVQYPFAPGGQLVKVDVDDPTGQRNRYFSHGPSSVIGEPTFVRSPNAETEDDGLLLSLGLETLSKRSILFIVDAKNMREIGRVEMPTVVPFGFHSRYVPRDQLEESTMIVDQQPQQQQKSSEESIETIFDRIYPNLSPVTAVEQQKSIDQKPNTPLVLVQREPIAPPPPPMPSQSITSVVPKSESIIDTFPASSSSSSFSNPSTTSKTDSIIGVFPAPSSMNPIVPRSESTTGLASASTSSSIGSTSPNFESTLSIAPPLINPVVPKSERTLLVAPPLSNPIVPKSESIIGIDPTSLSSKPFPPEAIEPVTPVSVVAGHDTILRGVYLSNGSFVQMLPDGTLVSGPRPTAGAVRQPAVAQLPLPVQPTSSLVLATQSPPRAVVIGDIPPPSNPINDNEPLLRQYFPALFTQQAPATPTIAPLPSSNGSKNSFIVVDVVVDPNKRTRRPLQSPQLVALPVNDALPVRPTSSGLSWRAAKTSTKSSAENEEVQKAADALLARLFERGKVLVCDFFGAALKKFGSEFCHKVNETRPS